MLVEHPAYATLPASDLARAKQFYAEKLGFTPESETPEGLFYRSGDATRFLLYPSGGTPSGSHTQMGWTVIDLEAEVAALKAKGVLFEEYDYPGLNTINSIAERDDIKSAWFKDSEGNLLGLVQFLSQQ
jgi:catechol 2,3-dioxygenase-like lactoylglutathione lyase family enzyme